MKIEYFDNVVKLIEIKNKCEKALDKLATYKELYEAYDNPRPARDGGGLLGFSRGYFAHLSLYGGGFDAPVSLHGCYVGKEVAFAIEKVLKDQIRKVNDALRGLGVEVIDEEQSYDD